MCNGFSILLNYISRSVMFEVSIINIFRIKCCFKNIKVVRLTVEYCLYAVKKFDKLIIIIIKLHKYNNCYDVII